MNPLRPLLAGRHRPSTLTIYVAAVIVLGGGVWVHAATLVATEGLRPSDTALFVVFVLSLLGTELRPLSRMRKGGGGMVTVSLAYAFALMFVTPGMLSAVLVGAASLIADLAGGAERIKAVFNTAMMSLALAAGLTILRLTDTQTALTNGSTDPFIIVPIVLACAAVFIVNQTLINIVIALATQTDLRTVMRRDFFMSLPTDGILLPLGPVLVVVGHLNLVLLPFAMLLTLAVYRSARDAAERERDATHDHLTGLPNRRLFEDDAEQALELIARSGCHIGVLLIDLDGFKEVNDHHGHQAGDEVLVAVAGRLLANVPSGATVSRLGGDEFAVLLPSVRSTEDAEMVAVTLGAALHEPLVSPSSNGLSLRISGSIGVAVSGPGLGSLGELTRAADTAMYTAKRMGSGHSLADHGLAGGGQYAELDRAISEGQLFMMYQPLVDARTEAVTGFEALVRWDRPGHGVIPPARFMRLAESTSLIGPLTHFVIDEALAHLGRIRAAGHPLRMSVNISARNLSDPSFAAEVAGLLTRHDIDASLLTLEITETAVMTDERLAGKLLTRLADIGVGLSLDDFGAGHSSLSKLRDLPVTELKIDRSFLTDLTNSRDRAMIRTFVQLAASLGMSTVAEGVEDRSIMSFLAEVGCDVVQGFAIREPAGASDSLAWLEGRTSVLRTPVDGLLIDLVTPLHGETDT